MGFKSLSQRRIAGESAIASGIGVYASLSPTGGYNISGQSLTTTTSVTQTTVIPGQTSDTATSNVGSVVVSITSVAAANSDYNGLTGGPIYANSYIKVLGTGFVPLGYLTLNGITLAGNVYYSTTELRANLNATSNISNTGNLSLAYYTPPTLIKSSNLYITPPPILYLTATGGNVTINGNYKVHVFDGNTGSNVFTVTAMPDSGVATVQYLILSGGGGGGAKYCGFNGGGGGGGGGGVLQGCVPVTAQAYAITIGAGGAGSGSWIAQPNAGQRGGPGANSSAFGFTVVGGGAGGGTSNGGTATGLTGSSGGGGGGSPSSGAVGGCGTPGYGFAGGRGGPSAGSQAGGGGGGAGGKGVGACSLGAPACRSACMPKDAGLTHGGYGILTCIQGPGANLAIGGGGGGSSPTCGAGGYYGGVFRGGVMYGGGVGSSNSQACVYNATRGAANKGGGGGGDARGTSGGAQGGSGVVIVKYRFQ